MKELCFVENEPGDSVFVGVPTLWEAKVAVESAGLRWAANSVMAAADDEGELGYTIRDYLVAGETLQPDYELGLLTLPDGENTASPLLR